MHIQNITLINFKNFAEETISLHPKVNCFVGNNGVGKTNMLDAVYYLCMTKSYFQLSDQYSVRQGSAFMALQAGFEINGTNDEIYCALKTGNRKQLRKNKKEYPKLSDHIGNYPVVMISPSDSSLISDGSDERRKYLNAVISQYDHGYLNDVILYNKILVQRNKLLKDFQKTPGAAELLEIYTEQLIPCGVRIFEKRNTFLNKLLPIFKEFYSVISQNSENIGLKYVSQLTGKHFGELLSKSHNADLQAQTTTCGVHKDDIDLLMDGCPIKKIGSQGQQKTFLVALKLAQFSFIKQVKNITPILLLDDIFDKFDIHRVKQILNMVSGNSFGQIFITHTNEQRMKELLEGITDGYKIFRVENNSINLAI
ncbi:MAG: DNA replication/repair protein RecF [Bacteroidales bacterium]|nr:DNA replication/repair protein RecF [Bacteroidales bacterium]